MSWLLDLAIAAAVLIGCIWLAGAIIFGMLILTRPAPAPGQRTGAVLFVLAWPVFLCWPPLIDRVLS